MPIPPPLISAAQFVGLLLAIMLIVSVAVGAEKRLTRHLKQKRRP